MVAASDFYSSVSSCTNVRVLLVYVKGLIVRAQYALPSLCMVVRPRYLFTNTYTSLRALLCMPGMFFYQRTRLCCLDVVRTRKTAPYMKFLFVLFFKSCFASIELTIFALTSLQLASTPLRWRTYLRFFACVRPSHPIDSEQCEHECIRTSGHPLVRGTNVNCF